MLSQTNVKMHDCMGRQRHFIWRYNYNIDDLLILMVDSQGRITNIFCWMCWSVAHFTQTELWVALNSSVVGESVSENTKNKNQWLKTCTHTMYASAHGPSTSTSTVSSRVRVKVRVHCFRVRVLKMSTRVRVPSTTSPDHPLQQRRRLRLCAHVNACPLITPDASSSTAWSWCEYPLLTILKMKCSHNN